MKLKLSEADVGNLFIIQPTRTYTFLNNFPKNHNKDVIFLG